MRKSLFSIILLIILCVPSAAQSGWLDRAKEAMNSETGQNILGTLGGMSPATGNAPGNIVTNGLSNTDIIAGLKQALEIGTTQVTQRLGAVDGFNLDPTAHIPLPGTLAKVDQALGALGMGGLTQDLELRLNRAAEAAAPRAKALFIDAITSMSIEDAKGILNGPQDAATQYLRKAMGPQLSQDIQPIIQQTLSQAGAIQAYDQVMGRYQQIPFMPDAKANLNSYVSEKALDGIFHYVAQEEASIRSNPAKRTTDLLKTVFGS